LYFPCTLAILPLWKVTSRLFGIMPKKIIKDISASTLQVVINQLLGLGIFFILSRQLTKPEFGVLNFDLATLTVFWGIASMGMDLIAAKKIASGNDAKSIAGVHMIHAILSGSLYMLAFSILLVIFPGKSSGNSLLLKLFLSLLLTYLSTPFKQLAYGKRMFFILAMMSTTAAFSRLVFLFVILVTGDFNLNNVALVFVISSFVEFVVSGFLILKRINIFPLAWSKTRYLSLMKESLPQFGVVIFNSVLARFDWILLGLLSTSVVTADYVFAYKIFELSKLPLWIISPVLMPVFTGFFSRPRQPDQIKLVKSKLLFSGETFVSVFIPLLIAVIWLPVMNHFYGGKYGAAALDIFLVLSVCVPLQFATDYYWNLCIAQGQLKLTTKIFFLSTLLNVILNLCLIPIFGAVGAAWSFVGSYLLQLLLYKKYTNQERIKPEIVSLFKAIACGVASLAICFFFVSNIFVSAFAVIMLYLVFSLLTRNVVIKKVKTAVNIFIR
jgi:O-antigen/teichoic acid export membrane protein